MFTKRYQNAPLPAVGLSILPDASYTFIYATRRPSWCWHTRATQKRWKKFLHFEVI